VHALVRAGARKLLLVAREHDMPQGDGGDAQERIQRP
jgi:hypothetical protein